MHNGESKDMQELYQKFLGKVEEGLTFRETLPPNNSSGIFLREFQTSMIKWWKENGLPNEGLQKLLSSSYKNIVIKRIMALTVEGKRFEESILGL